MRKVSISPALFAVCALVLGACASGKAIRTSSNTMIIQASAAPACRASGAADVAQQVAAIETIRAGYDAYVVVGADSQNNVVATRGPGTVSTSGQGTYGNGQVRYQETSTYNPGMPIIAGSHDSSLAIRMYRAGEPGYENAIPARDILGPDWEQKVKSGVSSCL